MLPFKILTQVQFDLVTLPEAKSQCHVTPSNSREDDYISMLILAAASTAQEYLNWMVSEGIVKQYAAEGGYLSLYGKYVTAITEVTATDATGELVTLVVDDGYTYNSITEEVYVSDTDYYDIYISYACGATEDDLPATVKHAVLMIISTMFNNREDFITGLSVEKMPMTSMKLLERVRNYVS